jgi:kojibiose phosphorylase
MRELLSSPEWLVVESGFDPARANVYETLLTVGNGFLGTRGTLEEGHRGERSGTFLAGVYDDHDSPVVDLVNAPDWLSMAVYVDGVRLDVHNCTVVEHERVLDMHTGLMYRRTVFEDARGRRTRLETLRCASVADRRICVLGMEVTPENHDPEITVDSAVDGRRRNLERLPVYPAGAVIPTETKWEKWAHTKHLRRVARDVLGDVAYLEMATIGSGITVGYAAVTTSPADAVSTAFRLEDERIVRQGSYRPGAGVTLRLEKVVAISTSRGRGSASVREECRSALDEARSAGFDAVVTASRDVWDSWWDDCDC